MEVPGTATAAEWNTELWRPYGGPVSRMQAALASVGAAGAVARAAATAVDEEALHEAVLVGAAQLVGGHPDGQRAFLARLGGGGGDRGGAPELAAHSVWRALHGQVATAIGLIRKRRKRLVVGAGDSPVLLARAALEHEKFAAAMRLTKHTLRFLQLLCEGHNAELQVLMAGQPGAPESFGMVTIVCHLVSAICAGPEVLTIALLFQAQQFLIETMQVCQLLCVCTCVCVCVCIHVCVCVCARIGLYWCACAMFWLYARVGAVLLRAAVSPLARFCAPGCDGQLQLCLPCSWLTCCHRRSLAGAMR